MTWNDVKKQAGSLSKKFKNEDVAGRRSTPEIARGVFWWWQTRWSCRWSSSLWDGGSAILPFLCLPPKNSKMRRYGWKRVRSEDYDNSESALSGVSAQPVEILLCHNCHQNYCEPSIQIELDLHAYPICRVVVTNVTIQPWAFHRKFLTIQSSQ